MSAKRPHDEEEINDHLSDLLSRSPTPDSQFDKSQITDQVNLDGKPDWGPVVTCLWDDCGLIFGDQHLLIEHILNFHIGHKQSNKYSCEWVGCSRKGKNQTSRFALVSHLRSHTGEKPFVCQERAECDRSFTRSDALSKHMRVQHHIEPTQNVKSANDNKASDSKSNKNKKPKTESPNKQQQQSGGASGSQQNEHPAKNENENESIYLDENDKQYYEQMIQIPDKPLNWNKYLISKSQHKCIISNNHFLSEELNKEKSTLNELENQNNSLLSSLIELEVDNKSSKDFFKQFSTHSIQLNKSLKPLNNNKFKSSTNFQIQSMNEIDEIDD